MPLNISPIRVLGASKKENLTTIEQNNASICVIFLDHGKESLLQITQEGIDD